MADPQTAPRTDMAEADAANGEPAAMEQTKPSVERGAGDEVRDDEAEHPTGDKQAEKNRENEPPG